MQQYLVVKIPGGNTHLILLERLAALQFFAEIYGGDQFPIMLRIRRNGSIQLQPVRARALLDEVAGLQARLKDLWTATVELRDQENELLGGLYGLGEDGVISRSSEVEMQAGPHGIRLIVSGFPPPVGFRSETGLGPGRYECYFLSLSRSGTVWQGMRTLEMGGSGQPVAIPAPAIPPLARWHYTHSGHGASAVSKVVWSETRTSEVLRDVIHAFQSACTESLRLRVPLEIGVD